MITEGKEFISLMCIGGLRVIFMEAGLFLLWKLWGNWHYAQQSSHWQTTQGKVLHSGVDAQTDTDEEGTRRTTYRARVIYQYELAGQHYQSDHISFNEGVRTNNFHSQELIAARYPQEKGIAVYYNPRDPQETVLERRVSAFFTTILFALVFLLLGIFVLVSSLSSNPPAFLEKFLGY